MSNIPRKKLKLSPKEKDPDFDDWGEEITEEEFEAVCVTESQALAEAEAVAASSEPASSGPPKIALPAKRSTEVAFKTSERVEQRPKSNLTESENQRSKIQIRQSKNSSELKGDTKKAKQSSFTSKRTLCENSGFNDIENENGNNSFEMKNLQQQLYAITSQLNQTKEDNLLSTGEAIMLREKLRAAESEKNALTLKYQKLEEKYIDEQKNEKLENDKTIEKLNTELLFKKEEIRRLERRSTCDVPPTPVTESQKKTKSPNKENPFLTRFSIPFDLPRAGNRAKAPADCFPNQAESSTNSTEQKNTRSNEMRIKVLRGKVKGPGLVCQVFNSGSEGLLSLMKSKKENPDSVHKKKSISPPNTKDNANRCQRVSFGIDRLLKSTNEPSNEEAEKLFKTGITSLLPVIERQILTYADMTSNLREGKKNLVISPNKMYSPELFSSSSSGSSNTSEVILTQKIIEQIRTNTISNIGTLITLLTHDPALAKNTISTLVNDDDKTNRDPSEVVPMETDDSRLINESRKSSAVVKHISSIISFYQDEGLKMSRLTNSHKDKLILHAALKLLVLLVPHFDDVNYRLLRPQLITGALGNCLHLDNRMDIAAASLDVGCSLVSNGFSDWLCMGPHGTCFISHVNILCTDVFKHESRVVTKILTKTVHFVCCFLSNSNGVQSELPIIEGCSCFSELFACLVSSLRNYIFIHEDTLSDDSFNLIRHSLKFLTKLFTNDSHRQIRRQSVQPFYHNLLIKLANLWVINRERLTLPDFLSIQELWEYELGGIERLQ